ncbi:MAG TPA: glycosyltransferase family 87 protein [Anaerolineales bacterium]|nr:glycosyltransferase family 87 protein [Anaerolineales bacterium]
MRSISLHRIFIIAGIASIFISYLAIWIRFINDPVERTGSDFIAFYSAGRVAQIHGTANAYDPRLQQQIQQEEVGFPLVPGQVLLYNHLPFLIPLLQIIVSTDYVASFYRWVILLIMLYIAGVTVLSLTLKQTGSDRGATLLTGIGAFLFLPVFFSLMNGQDTAILFLGVALWGYGLLAGKEILAGVGLSLAAVRPHIALLLAIPAVFRYARVFAGFLLGSGFLAILSLLILGPNGTRDFINIIFLSAGGEWYGMKENAMYNLIGLLTRSAPQLEAGTIRALGWGFYGLAFVFLCAVWSKAKDPRNGLIGMSVILALFAAPHLHFHDLALLLIPVYELIRLSRETGNLKPPVAISLPIALSLLLLLSNLTPFLQYTIPYIILLVLAVYPYYATRRMTATAPHQS